MHVARSRCPQEFSILAACMKFTEACGEIVDECERAGQVPDELLSDMLEEVMDYCETLQHFSQKRKTAIVEMEKHNLEEFRRLHQSVENRANVETNLTAVGTAGGAVAAAAAGPVGLVAAALLGLAAGYSLRTRRDAANRVQQSWWRTFKPKMCPFSASSIFPRVAGAFWQSQPVQDFWHDPWLRCMEAFAKNLDDAIERIAEGALCSHQAPPGDDLGRDPRCADEPPALQNYMRGISEDTFTKRFFKCAACNPWNSAGGSSLVDGVGSFAFSMCRVCSCPLSKDWRALLAGFRRCQTTC